MVFRVCFWLLDTKEGAEYYLEKAEIALGICELVKRYHRIDLLQCIVTSRTALRLQLECLDNGSNANQVAKAKTVLDKWIGNVLTS